MSKWTVLGLFCAVACIQCVIPASMVVRREWTLEHGQRFQFKAAPVDPYDAFRGRFVAIGVEARTAPNPAHLLLDRGQRVYAIIEEDDNGFSKFSGVALERPENSPYIETTVAWVTGLESVSLKLPFDRYYLDESLAPEAERVYRAHSRTEQDTYVAVRVYDGFAVIEELYVDNTPIVAYVQAKQATAQ